MGQAIKTTTIPSINGEDIGLGDLRVVLQDGLELVTPVAIAKEVDDNDDGPMRTASSVLQPVGAGLPPTLGPVEPGRRLVAAFAPVVLKIEVVNCEN